MFKTALAAATLLSSNAALAQTCPVDVRHDIHIAEEQVSVYQGGQAKMWIDPHNQVFVDGKPLELNTVQQQAVEAYSQAVKTYLPQVAEVADDGVSIASDIMNEVASRFDSGDSFTGVKTLIADYSQKAHEKFYPEGEFVMPANIFETADTDWRQEFEQAMKHVSVESMSNLFSALTEKMKNGDISFSELQQQFGEMKAAIEAKVRERSGEVAEKAGEVCESIKGLAEEEQQLHRVVPELKEYQMFEI